MRKILLGPKEIGRASEQSFSYVVVTSGMALLCVRLYHAGQWAQDKVSK